MAPYRDALRSLVETIAERDRARDLACALEERLELSERVCRAVLDHRLAATATLHGRTPAALLHVAELELLLELLRAVAAWSEATGYRPPILPGI